MERNLLGNGVLSHRLGGFKFSETVRFLVETYRNHPAKTLSAIRILWIYIDETNMKPGSGVFWTILA